MSWEGAVRGGSSCPASRTHHAEVPQEDGHVGHQAHGAQGTNRGEECTRKKRGQWHLGAGLKGEQTAPSRRKGVTKPIPPPPPTQHPPAQLTSIDTASGIVGMSSRSDDVMTGSEEAAVRDAWRAIEALPRTHRQSIRRRSRIGQRRGLRPRRPQPAAPALRAPRRRTSFDAPPPR